MSDKPTMAARMIYAVCGLLSIAAVAVVALIGVVLYGVVPFRGPNEIEVLQGSGLEFSQLPKLAKNTMKQSGPAGSDVQIVMEFDIDPIDVARFSDCKMPGYHRGSAHAGRYLVMGMFSRQASRPDQACWRFFSDDGDHVYVLFEARLYYQFLTPISDQLSLR